MIIFDDGDVVLPSLAIDYWPDLYEEGVPELVWLKEL